MKHISDYDTINEDVGLVEFVNDKDLFKALEKIRAKAIINREFDIPYLAGYSTNDDSKQIVIYIDKDLPLKEFIGNDVKMLVDNFLVSHELTELFLQKLFKMDYEESHKLALQIEKSLVVNAGVNWNEYCDFFKEWIPKIGEKKVTSTPPDLNLKPYTDSNDEKTLEEIEETSGPNEEISMLSEEMQMKVIQFLLQNPKVKDEELHAWATENGYTPEEIEEYIYEFTADVLKRMTRSMSEDDSQFIPEELKRGIEVEKEHTSNEILAKMIAKDHLKELPNYYTILDYCVEKNKEESRLGKIEARFNKAKK